MTGPSGAAEIFGDLTVKVARGIDLQVRLSPPRGRRIQQYHPVQCVRASKFLTVPDHCFHKFLHGGVCGSPDEPRPNSRLTGRRTGFASNASQMSCLFAVCERRVKAKAPSNRTLSWNPHGEGHALLYVSSFFSPACDRGGYFYSGTELNSPAGRNIFSS